MAIISWTVCLILMGFSVWYSSEIEAYKWYNEHENWVVKFTYCVTLWPCNNSATTSSPRLAELWFGFTIRLLKILPEHNLYTIWCGLLNTLCYVQIQFIAQDGFAKKISLKLLKSVHNNAGVSLTMLIWLRIRLFQICPKIVHLSHFVISLPNMDTCLLVSMSTCYQVMI